MKRIIFFVILSTMSVILLFLTLGNESSVQKDLTKEVFRIHIRANSNTEYDQLVKYKVKVAVSEFITPLLVGATTKENAISIIKNNLQQITKVANNVLEKNGFCYDAKSKIAVEKFPTRDYNGITFSEGNYDALLIELGDAKGDNWWCVVYPPLCFIEGYDVGSKGIFYQSKLKEIVEKFFND